MGRRKRFRCKECDELIDFEDLVYCEKCEAPLHDWCARGVDYAGFEDANYCSECAAELEEEIEDSDEYDSSNRCPVCGTYLVKEENLVWCPNCGYEPY